MWQLSLLSGLILTIICRAVPQQLPDARQGSDEDPTDQPSEGNSRPPTMNVNSESFLNTNACGQRHGTVLDAEFPWIVAISDSAVPDSPQFMAEARCLGSLIHPQVVLTEASCVQESIANPEEVVIRAGAWNISMDTMKLHQDRSVKRIIIDEKWNETTLLYGYAILILSEPVELASNVGLVCLPLDDDWYDTALCTTNSAGTITFDWEVVDINIQKDKPDIIPHSTCQHTFECTPPDVVPDACQLTLGAPLVCPSQDNTYYQYGIVVEALVACNGYGRGETHAPILEERKWIEETIANNRDLLIV